MTTKKKIKTSKDLALYCSKLALDKKAFNVILMDITPWHTLNDYVLICSALSSVHAQTIIDTIRENLKKEANLHPLGLEGYAQGNWILLDYNDVIIHVLYEYVREFYDLENLWHDAPRLKIPKSYYKKIYATK